MERAEDGLRKRLERYSLNEVVRQEVEPQKRSRRSPEVSQPSLSYSIIESDQLEASPPGRLSLPTEPSVGDLVELGGRVVTIATSGIAAIAAGEICGYR
jgi:hypothetical protein